MQSEIDKNIIGISSRKGGWRLMRIDSLDLLSLSARSSTLNRTDRLTSVINARRLYASCIDEDGIEMNSVDALMAFIDSELGGWPMLQGSAWNSSKFNLMNLLVKLNQYRRFFFYDVTTYLDERNSSINCIYVRGQRTFFRSTCPFLHDRTDLDRSR